MSTTSEDIVVSNDDAKMVEDLHGKFMQAQAAVGELRVRHLNEESDMIRRFGEAQQSLMSALDFIAKRNNIDTSGPQAMRYDIEKKSFCKI